MPTVRRLALLRGAGKAKVPTGTGGTTGAGGPTPPDPPPPMSPLVPDEHREHTEHMTIISLIRPHMAKAIRSHAKREALAILHEDVPPSRVRERGAVRR